MNNTPAKDNNHYEPRKEGSVEILKTMPQTTLIYVFNTQGQMLLAVKKKSESGFEVSVEKVNTAGGKQDAGETIEHCALRELQQEFGIIVSERQLESAGVVRFHFDTKKEWDNECHVYKVMNYTGGFKDSEEMKEIRYFNTQDLPREAMRESDKTWLPKMLKGEMLNEDFYHTDDGKVISHSSKI